MFHEPSASSRVDIKSRVELKLIDRFIILIENSSIKRLMTKQSDQ